MDDGPMAAGRSVSDGGLVDRINELAREEEQLWEQASDGDGLPSELAARVDRIRIELDQAYDLLRQRQARRAAGLDPDDARVRPADVVEGYEQ